MNELILIIGLVAVTLISIVSFAWITVKVRHDNLELLSSLLADPDKEDDLWN